MPGDTGHGGVTKRREGRSFYSTALPDSTRHDDDDTNEETQGGVPARDKAKYAKAPIGSVPRRLRNDLRPAPGGDLFELADNRIPRDASSRLIFCERDIFPLPCCPNPPRVKRCRRTQQVNGRRRMTTEFANDAVNSLNWLAGHKNSSLIPRIHVESTDEKLSAPGAVSVMKLFDVSQQLRANGRGPTQR